MNDFSPLIRSWYRLNKRDLPWRNTIDPYQIWLSEIIMQQTRVEQGLKYYLKFIQNYPTILDLANANEQSILNDWQGLGYYSRARNLHHSAKVIRDEYEGEFPKDFKTLIKLKGVGVYTASAISSFANNENKAVVDGNVYRFLSRVFDIDTAIDSTEGIKLFQELANDLLDTKKSGEHNQAIMEMGALICTPKKPSCDKCPLQVKCLAYSNQTITSRPHKSKKTKVRTRYFHFQIYKEDNTILLEKREKKDIWQNLFQFPMIETDNSKTPATKISIQSRVHQSEVIKHILSHQKLLAVFHYFDSFPTIIDSKFVKVNIADIQNYPLPRLIDKYLEDSSYFFK